MEYSKYPAHEYEQEKTDDIDPADCGNGIRQEQAGKPD